VVRWSVDADGTPQLQWPAQLHVLLLESGRMSFCKRSDVYNHAVVYVSNRPELSSVYSGLMKAVGIRPSSTMVALQRRLTDESSSGTSTSPTPPGRMWRFWRWVSLALGSSVTRMMPTGMCYRSFFSRLVERFGHLQYLKGNFCMIDFSVRRVFDRNQQHVYGVGCFSITCRAR